jgi:preprotein translocase subunit SecG
LIYVLYTIFILAALFLILVILLQSGKGGDVASAFGGGSQTAFGPRGAQKPLEKATIYAAITFMLVAFIFSLPSVTGGRSVVKDPGKTPVPSPSVAAVAPSIAVTAAPAASAAASLAVTGASVKTAASVAVKDDKKEVPAKPAASVVPDKK